MIHIYSIDYGAAHPMRDVINTLAEAGDYFDSRADCDHDDRGYVPNDEMMLTCACANSLEELGESEIAHPKTGKPA